MRLLWCIEIEEHQTTLCSCLHIPNRLLAIFLASFQLLVALASFCQVKKKDICHHKVDPRHILSIYLHRHIFLCRSKIGSNEPWQVEILAYDIIIYDFGLMRRILGTEECPFWPCFVFRSHFGYYGQSSYSLGMSVLSMATAPKILEALGGHVDFRLSFQFGAYLFGFMVNWLFTFVLWHYYWHMENRFKQNTLPTSAPRHSRTVAHV